MNGFGSSADPPSVAFFMLASSAEAKRSAGAPLFAWPARVDDESNENFTWLPGLAASNAFPISVKESVSEAAASTVMSPTGLGAAVVAVVAPGVVLSSLPQATPRRARATRTAAQRRSAPERGL